MKKLLVLVWFITSLVACKDTQPLVNSETAHWYQLTGSTMGTTFNITYEDALDRNLQISIDSLLVAFNLEVSTYIEESTISQFNRSSDSFTTTCDLDSNCNHFIANLLLASKIQTETAGHFDPTVMPLVNYWGFGYTEKRAVTEVDKAKIANMMKSVGLDKLNWEAKDGHYVLNKKQADLQLDFSAIAKGYAVDLVGHFLKKQNIFNFMVEIGGEVVTAGHNSQQKTWSLGIRRPQADANTRLLEAVIGLENKGLATSGNYENFYEVDGQKYAHTIHPKTGYPEGSNLLSASIVAESCAAADSYATACMVMGYPKALDFIKQLENVDAFFIYSKPDGSMGIEQTDGLNILSAN